MAGVLVRPSSREEGTRQIGQLGFGWNVTGVPVGLLLTKGEGRRIGRLGFGRIMTGARPAGVGHPGG
ncbi:hypothetical protein [Cereibacter johrii]|uniref:hypothetical protein n=1 Tax=Cereibacter johrii TaxID=445629 RepID=UPI0011BF9F4D|nr:hypothetical protein [Cereibacter johrii]